MKSPRSNTVVGWFERRVYTGGCEERINLSIERMSTSRTCQYVHITDRVAGGSVCSIKSVSSVFSMEQVTVWPFAS